MVVVGAGLAGLTAADYLRRRGRTVLVLEAADRVGGRVLDRPIAGSEIAEVGAEFIGPTQNRIAALAARLDVRTFKTYLEGNNVYHRNGVRTPYPKESPLPPDPGAAEAVKLIVQLDQMASEVPRERPQSAPRAEEYDSQTFETFLERNTATPFARFLGTLASRAIFSAEPRDLSLLFVLFYISAAGDEQNPGSIVRLISTEGGAQENRFVGGAQQVPNRLARRLGSRVVLGAPVRRIVQRAGRVRVEADGVDAVAQRVIVAVPPALAARIEYAPGLPASRDQLSQRYPMGSVTKVNVVYRRPFWRDAGLTGSALGDLDPLQVTFDNTPPDGGPGVLMGFIEADAARRLDSESRRTRRAQVIENLAAYFGEEARDPIGYVEKLWDRDVWHRGCPVGLPTTGTLLAFGDALRAPVGRIHWAGTETSPIWNGYMDGAVRSGERAGAEVLPRLSQRRLR
ncbi:MAG: flavin monoamine oxidase family protein, partial [Thermoleophilaceae bacterium]